MPWKSSDVTGGKSSQARAQRPVSQIERPGAEGRPEPVARLERDEPERGEEPDERRRVVERPEAVGDRVRVGDVDGPVRVEVEAMAGRGQQPCERNEAAERQDDPRSSSDEWRRDRLGESAEAEPGRPACGAVDHREPIVLDRPPPSGREPQPDAETPRHEPARYAVPRWTHEHAFANGWRRGRSWPTGPWARSLFSRGIPQRASLDELVATRPDLIGAIHREYLEAGADIIETATFGANRIRLAPHGLADQAGRFSRRGAQIAREARDVAGRDVLVAGSVGPLGAPTRGRAPTGRCRGPGRLPRAVDGLLEGGVDLFRSRRSRSSPTSLLAIEEARARPPTCRSSRC